MKNVQISVNGQSSPLVIDLAYGPYFGWKYTGEYENDFRQKAYRIVVKNNGSVVWDSGRIESGKQYMVVYEGDKMSSLETYDYTITLWDENDSEVGSFSGSFDTGASEKDFEHAKWLTGEGIIRKELTIDKDIKKARVYASAVGYYELYCNSKKVGDQVLCPSHTDPDSYVEYQAYDVTDLLNKGKNSFAFITGGGLVANEPFFLKETPVIMLLVVDTTEGERLFFNTDDTWRSYAGPIVQNNFYTGEKYDARLEPVGWKDVNFLEIGKECQIADSPKGELSPQILPPIRIVEEILPKEIFDRGNGNFVVDFGQNFAGVERIRVSGEKGQTITLRPAELLNEDGSVNQLNLRMDMYDTYTLSGGDEEVFQPRFTYRAFRYLGIENWQGEMKPENVVGCIMHSDVEKGSVFECSDDLYNRIHKAMHWSLINNLYSIPTDGPQRNERRGWMGDAQTVSESNIYNYDMHWFYRKWLKDIRGIINEETGILSGSAAPRFDTCTFFVWQAAVYIIPHRLLKLYDDKEIVKQWYPLLKKNLANVAEHVNSESHVIIDPGNLDKTLVPYDNTSEDWLCIERTRNIEIINAYYYLENKIMKEFAQVLGIDEDVATYQRELNVLKDAYNKAFLFHRTRTPHLLSVYGKDCDISQLSQAMPLYFGITPDADVARIFDFLVFDLCEERGETQLTTGIIGTQIVIDLLAQFGRNDVVSELFSRRRYPSWGYMLDKGGTAIWERWQYLTGCDMNSHCHAAFASPDKWFYYGLAGLGLGEVDDNDRYTFVIKPYIHPGLDHAKASIDTPWGRASSSWKKTNGKVELDVIIPPNAKAEVDFCDFRKTVGSGRHTFTV